MRNMIQGWIVSLEGFTMEVILRQRRDKWANMFRSFLFMLRKVFPVAIKVRRLVRGSRR